ncbi:MAG: cobyrinic acid a,c-diamide synthase, partial [Thermoproteota archaeon]|nr:cobyrinic acid a,c-diamide synthase [Thermoproteota archaeon]
NNVSSERHIQYITEAFKSKVKVPVVGIIYKDKDNKLDGRHLGLIPTLELNANKIDTVLEISKKTAQEIDIEKVIEIAQNNTEDIENTKVKDLLKNNIRNSNKQRITISIALDKSFNFYYQDNIEILQNQVNIDFFSPIDCKSVSSDSSGIIIGGGFPEVIADELEKNTSIKKNILKLAHNNIPVYAECGGLMYLTKSISGYKNKDKKYKMVGLFDADTIMTGKLTLGYTEATLNNKNTIFGDVKVLKGHEFHYSSIPNYSKDSRFVYTLKKGKGIANGLDGLSSYNCIASYMHTHFVNSNAVKNFILNCRQYSKR